MLTKTDLSAHPRPWRAILLAGAVAGVLDLVFAYFAFGRPFPRLLRGIAGGLFGPAAHQGGAGTAVIGFVCHFVISIGAAATYYFAAKKFSWLNRYPVVSGIVFGLLVYEFMHLVVLPLSAYHSPLAFPSLLARDVASHLFLVGLPIALIVRIDLVGGWKKPEPIKAPVS